MDEDITSDLSTHFDAAITLSSKCKYQDMKILDFNRDLDSQCDIDFYKTTIQSNSKFVQDEIKENEEDFDTENEDLLLGIKDQDGNLVKYDDNEYDLTEEQENYLLSDNCMKHYIKSLNSCNLNELDITNDDDKLFFIDVTPFSVDQNISYDQHSVKIDTTISSIIDLCDGSQHLILRNLADEDTKNSDFSNAPTQQIHFKGVGYNSEIESKVFSYDSIKKEKYFTNSGEENITEGIISDIYDERTQFNCTDSTSGSLYEEVLTKTIEENTCVSSRNLLIDSSTTENDKIDSNVELKVEEIAENREFELSKVMRSDSARKIYLDLLKDKAQSLFISYNKYKNGFLRSLSRSIDKLESGKFYKKKENLSIYHSKRTETKLLGENTDVSIIDIQPLNNLVERANDVNESQFYNLKENQIVQTMESNGDPLQNTNVGGEFLEQIIPKSNYRKINDAANNDKTNVFMDEKTEYTPNELFFDVSEDSTSRKITDTLELRNGNVSQTFGVEQIQNAKMEDLSDPRKCIMSNQISMTTEDSSAPDKIISNEICETFPRSKFTEILNNSLFTGYEEMDFQSTSNDSNIVQCPSNENDVPDIEETNVYSEPKLQKKRKKHQIRIARYNHSERFSARRHKNLKIRTHRQKLSNTNVSIQTLLDLFNLNNNIVINILSALLSEQFKTGALLTDIMKYLRREMAIEKATKLRQDIEKFLKAAVDAGIVQMKRRRYILKGEKICGRRKTTKNVLNKYQTSTNVNLRKRPKIDK